MMLSPKKQKYRKQQKGRVARVSKAALDVDYGSHGLKSLDQFRITARQIESARKAAVKQMNRCGRFWIRVFPDVPISKKPAEVRMGKGKGSPEFFAARVAMGRILFEVAGVSDDIACKALSLAAAKLPIKTKIVKRYGNFS